MDDQGATQLSLLCHEASTRRSGLFILLRLVGFSMGTHSHPGPNHPKHRWNVSRPGSLTSIGKLEKNDFGQPGYSNHCPAKGSGRAAPASSNIRGVGVGSADSTALCGRQLYFLPSGNRRRRMRENETGIQRHFTNAFALAGRVALARFVLARFFLIHNSAFILSFVLLQKTPIN